MWRLIILSVMQSALLAGAQVALKFAMTRMPAFSWSREFWLPMLVNWPFALSGICFALASLLWMYILKTFPLSVAYPLVSLSYVFGMVAAMFFFHEQIPLTRWAGVLLIIIGCSLIVK